jgi:hypothetical protein
MESIERLARPRRRLALFLIVFFVPFGVLTALAIRTLNQDREVATRRQEDERRGVATSRPISSGPFVIRTSPSGKRWS